MLISEGIANPNVADTSGIFPIHLAAFDETGSAICVSLLASAGADVSVQTFGELFMFVENRKDRKQKERKNQYWN